MAQLGPLTVTARNREQAAYLVRSRAEQRGIDVRGLDVDQAGDGVWWVTLTVTDDDAARADVGQLAEDTQVLHFRSHERRRPVD